ncbi:unnamed protein product, partial [marine sediment metagenome]
ADIIVSQEARKELEAKKGRKLTRDEKKALQTAIDEKLAIDKPTVDRIRKEVENESEEYKRIQEQFGEEPTGYSQRESNLRVYELIDQERGLDVTDKAFDIAGRAIGNIQAYGHIGWFIDGISKKLREPTITVRKPEVKIVKGKPIMTFNETKKMDIKPFALIIPFTRIVANVATRNMGWNPYIGAMRAKTGEFGAMLSESSPYRVDMTKEEKSKAWQKVVKIAMIHSLLFALTNPDDDDESVIRITLNGTGD